MYIKKRVGNYFFSYLKMLSIYMYISISSYSSDRYVTLSYGMYISLYTSLPDVYREIYRNISSLDENTCTKCSFVDINVQC